MEKEGKRITRWKTGATKLQGAAYLREMAEQGWILEDMNHLTHSFREDEPQYLTYRLVERESYLTEEERAEYAKDGWQEVCHYEREYVFVKEREPFEEDVEIQRQEVAEEIDREITLVKKNNKIYIWIFIIAVLIGFVVLLMSVGVSVFNRDTLMAFVTQLGPNLLIILVGGWMTMRRLRKKKERVMEGDIPEEYTDWRSSRRTTIFLVAVLLIGLGVWVYYASGFNEKTFDMPSEISYQEIPAVRLENLFDEPLTRTGESIDPKMEGFRVNPDMFAGVMYNNQKKLGGFENYGVEHRFLLKTEEKMGTYQSMKTADGTEYTLDTMYYRFRDIQDAGEEYSFLVRDEESMEDSLTALGIEFPERQNIEGKKDGFQNLHICKAEWTEGTAYHVVCHGFEGQVMELDFSYSHGEVTEKELVSEIKKVFDAQTK